MVNLLEWALILVSVVSLFYWAIFVGREGKDERGQRIQGKASYGVYILFTIGFFVINVYQTDRPMSVNHYQSAFMVLFGLMVTTNSLFVFYLRRKDV